MLPRDIARRRPFRDSNQIIIPRRGCLSPTPAPASRLARTNLWLRLACAQTAGIKSFIVNLVIARSSAEETYRTEKLFTNKLNVILVQVVKQEWPHNWPSFICDIVNASKTNETLCENNMIILKLLSEEVRAAQKHTHDTAARARDSRTAPDVCRSTSAPRPRLTLARAASALSCRCLTFRATR